MFVQNEALNTEMVRDQFNHHSDTLAPPHGLQLENSGQEDGTLFKKVSLFIYDSLTSENKNINL